MPQLDQASITIHKWIYEKAKKTAKKHNRSISNLFEYCYLKHIGEAE